MSKKKILDANDKVRVSIKALSFSDLYNMYSFVNGLNNVSFGQQKAEVKKLLRDKLKEIENELHDRTFGKNPFISKKDEIKASMENKEVIETSEIVGQNPIDVISSFPEVVETFVVKK